MNAPSFKVIKFNMDALYGVSQTYVPPDWAKGLTVIPKTRIKV